MCWVGRGIERIVERKGVFSAVRFGDLGKIRNAKLGTDRTQVRCRGSLVVVTNKLHLKELFGVDC